MEIWAALPVDPQGRGNWSRLNNLVLFHSTPLHVGGARHSTKECSTYSGTGFTMNDDGDLVDGLEPVDEVDDDRGVAIPGQVDGVCRYPL